MAVICVPNRRSVTCVLRGVQSRMEVFCQVPVRDPVHVCDYALQCVQPTYTDLVSAFGVSGVMSTLGVAGANPDDFVWAMLNHLSGEDSVEYFKQTFVKDPEQIPNGVVEGLLPGTAVQDRGYDPAGGGCRVVGASGRSWARGVLDSEYNRSLGSGGVASIGVAGIEGESAAAKRGLKPDSDEFPFPQDGLEDTHDPPGGRLGNLRWTECREDEERGEEWGTPGVSASPTYAGEVCLPVPLPEMFRDDRWRQDKQGGTGPATWRDRGGGAGLVIGDGLPSVAGRGADFTVLAHVNLAGDT